jgi:HEAT repeat protein
VDGARAENPVPVLALIEALHTGNDRARSNAATALGDIDAGAHRAVGDLRRLMRGTSARLRAAAAEALGKIGATEALPDLRALLSDTSEDVRIYATLAIATLSREPAEGGREADIPF